MLMQEKDEGEKLWGKWHTTESHVKGRKKNLQYYTEMPRNRKILRHRTKVKRLLDHGLHELNRKEALLLIIVIYVTPQEKAPKVKVHKEAFEVKHVERVQCSKRFRMAHAYGNSYCIIEMIRNYVKLYHFTKNWLYIQWKW